MAIAPELSSERVILGWREERKVQMLIDRWLDEVAAGLCTLIYAYNVPCVILGGSVMADSYAIAGVRERIKKKLIPEFRDVRILQADLGNKGGLYGAATSVRGIC
jgi:predicted NBD/HSP70 family sugar kinase